MQKKKKTNSVWIIDEAKYLNMSEVKQLQNFCSKAKTEALRKNTFSQIRNWFMIELGLNAGLRVSEMASLKHENLLLDNSRSSIVVIGKGDKKRAIWISSAFKKTCKTFLAYKTRFGYGNGTDSYLLNNLRDTKITKRSLQKAFKIIIEKSNLPSHYSIHCLRHTYSTFLLKASNHNYRFAQQQLGHASIRTTQVYAGILESEGRKAVENLYK